MKPYVKNFENGILTNPITKENPYLHQTPIRLKKILQQKTNFPFWKKVRSIFFTGKTPSYHFGI